MVKSSDATFEAEIANPAAGSSADNFVAVDASLFDTPFKVLGASGGTAAFFQVEYKDGEWKSDYACVDTKSYWIGKDLARARDEVEFYERAFRLKDRAVAGWDILNYTLPYRGVVRAPTTVGEKELLLLRNARDQYKTCRMLDVKIGEVTAIGGWQGKGHFDAYLQQWLDGATNSAGQGFRLEGFDGMPTTMQSLVVHALTDERTPVSEEVLERFLLQHMSARVFLRFFLDFHDTSNSSFNCDQEKHTAPPQPVLPSVPQGLQETLSEVETAELVLLSCIEELAGLVEACRNISTAQKWIGSSVMLAFDCELRPLRAVLRNGEDLPPGAAASIAQVRVSLFDWGRSELALPDQHQGLRKDRKQREHSWGQYCGGIAMLLFDCCLVYMRRYWHPKHSVTLSVWDRDVYTLNDIVGVLTVPLEDTPVTTAPIDESRGDFVRDTATELTYSITELELPDPTRLEKAWAVTVHRADNIPELDILSKSDGFVYIQSWNDPVEVAQGVEEGLGNEAAHNLLSIAAQATTVAQNHHHAVYEETFQIASLKRNGRNALIQALLKAFGGDGGLELAKDADGTPGALDGNFVEKQRSDFQPQQVVPLKRFSLEGSFFPVGMLEIDRQLAGGLGGCTSEAETLFVHYCFPELARTGLLSHGSQARRTVNSRIAFTVVLFLALIGTIIVTVVLFAEEEAPAIALAATHVAVSATSSGSS